MRTLLGKWLQGAGCGGRVLLVTVEGKRDKASNSPKFSKPPSQTQKS